MKKFLVPSLVSLFRLAVQFDFVLPTKEERYAESLLQMLHGTGNRRRGDVEFLRYAAERTQVGKSHKLA